MPKIRLTSAAAKRLKSPAKGQVDYFDDLLPSFGLRASYSGAKSWFVMTRVNGKLIRTTIGRFPGIPLREARSKARDIITLAQAGKSPRDIQRGERQAAAERQRNTFSALADEFMSRHVDAHLRAATAREYRRILQGPDTAHLKTKPISEISKRDIHDVLERIRKRGAHCAADRALAYLRKFMNWCVDYEVLDASPTDRIRQKKPSVDRERVLSDEEIAIVWSALESEKGLFAPLLKLLLLTGQRRSEVAGMRWEELRDIDGANPIWELPRDRTKNHLPHLVPLSSEVTTIIASVPRTGPLLFSGTGRAPASGFSKLKARLDRWIEANRNPIPHWTFHDFRRTMITKMNEDLRIAPHIAEATVNHVSGTAKRGVAGVYNRALYLDERRSALEAWSKYVIEVVESEQPVIGQ